MATFGNICHITEEVGQFHFSTLILDTSQLFYLLFLLGLVAHLNLVLFFLTSLFCFFNVAFDISEGYRREKERKCGIECVH